MDRAAIMANRLAKAVYPVFQMAGRHGEVKFSMAEGNICINPVARMMPLPANFPKHKHISNPSCSTLIIFITDLPSVISLPDIRKAGYAFDRTGMKAPNPEENIMMNTAAMCRPRL
jgi:hypothetical protein